MAGRDACCALSAKGRPLQREAGWAILRVHHRREHVELWGQPC